MLPMIPSEPSTEPSTESLPETPTEAATEAATMAAPESSVESLPETPVDAETTAAPESSATSGDAPVEASAETPAAPAVVSQPVPDVPPAPSPIDLSRMAQDFQIRKGQVDAVVQLLDEGNRVPFIARYRKERTGGLPEELVRRISERLFEIRAFADRKRTILKSIATHGKLTDELTAAILEADHPKWLEDLYQPFKPKKKSLAAEAKLRGWGPLAEAIWANDPAVADLTTVVAGMIDPDTTFTTADDILTGVKHILAEVIADSIAVRGPIRAFAWDTGTLVAARMEGLPEDKGREFRDFFDYNEPIRVVPPHRYLAVARGEREKVLTTRIVFDATKAKEIAADQLPQLHDNPHREFLLTVVDDAMSRLLLPSLDREIRKELTDRAHDQTAIAIARNLRSLLWQPPVRGKRVLAIDPGMRTGCKLAALDENGIVLEYDVVHPLPPQKRVEPAKKKIEYLIRKHGLNTVAIGNGPGCRDLEHLISDLIADFADQRINPRPIVSPTPPPVAMESSPVESPAAPVTSDLPSESVTAPAVDLAISSPMFSMPVEAGDATVVSTSVTGEAAVVTTEMAPGSAVVSSQATAEPAKPAPPPEPEIDLSGLPDASPDLCYLIVNEAGAAAYATGAAAKEEFPNLDPVTRGAISIGRRLQDPLAEFVKIDPLHLGPVFHPHEGRPKRLRELLEGVVESCVNEVGVDLNTAGLFLLRNVAGFNQLIAREIVTHRLANGPFTSREQLKTLPGMTEERFQQCAGFLRVKNGPEPLDETTVHPERYPLAQQLLTGLGFTTADLRDPKKRAAIDEAFRRANAEEWAKTLGIPNPAVIDLMVALARIGDDPRSELPPPVFKTRVLKMEDLAPGMELMGTVLNVVPFGAFVDIGVRESGLVHISQMANRYVKSPFDLVAVGDVVTVWVVDIKADEKKVSLTMIAPQAVRRPEPPPPRQERQERPARPATPRPQQPQRDDRPADRGQSGPRQSGPPPRPKRFAEPGAWRRAGQPAPAKQPAAQSAPPADTSAGSAQKKQRVKAVVTLSGEQKQGKAALNSFGQLFAFIKEREESPATEQTPPDAAPPPAKPE
jgi:uncharacterized protein